MVCNYVLLLELEELFVVNKLSSKDSFFSLSVVSLFAKCSLGVVDVFDCTFAIMMVSGNLCILHSRFL